MKFPVSLTFLFLLFLASCSQLSKTDGAEAVLITQPQPVTIQKETPPNTANKIIIKEEAAAPNAIELPKRNFKFRTPDLVNDLPSQKEIESSPSFINTIDDSVQENTTIRATD